MPSRRKLPTSPPRQPFKDWKETKEFKELSTFLGANVRQSRQVLGLTLEQASERMDVDLRHLAKIEAGQLNPTLVTLMRVAMGLGKPLEALFCRSPGETAPDPAKAGSTGEE